MKEPILPPTYFVLAIILVIVMHPLTPLESWINGSARLWGVVPAVFGIAFAWWIAQRFVAAEEQEMEARFGDAYRAYKERVRRWF